MSVTTELRDMLDAHGVEVTVHRPMTKAELARENRELRELVRDMYDFWGVDDDELGFAFKEEVTFSASVRDRMRELGVEVEW